jgi:hypothetical protein
VTFLFAARHDRMGLGITIVGRTEKGCMGSGQQHHMDLTFLLTNTTCTYVDREWKFVRSINNPRFTSFRCGPGFLAIYCFFAVSSGNGESGRAIGMGIYNTCIHVGRSPCIPERLRGSPNHDAPLTSCGSVLLRSMKILPILPILLAST